MSRYPSKNRPITDRQAVLLAALQRAVGEPYGGDGMTVAEAKWKIDRLVNAGAKEKVARGDWMATVKQRSYLEGLRRELGNTDPLPARMTVAEAADAIDRLLRQRDDSGSPRPASDNQLDYLRMLRDDLGDTDPLPERLTFDQASDAIGEAKKILEARKPK